MKAMTKISTAVMSFLGILMLCLVQTVALANGPDINVKVEKKGDWYAQPWVWIVGGAVFLLLLVALMRGGGKRD